MKNLKVYFDEYCRRAESILKEKNTERNERLVALENQMVDASGLGEGDRLELRAYMAEYRRQKINEFEAGAENPRISKDTSGPRSGEYG